MKLLIVLLLTCFSVLNAQNLNPCFGVVEDTYFPHPRTPSKFLACFDGRLQEGSCPPGMEFDRIRLYCDFGTVTTRGPGQTPQLLDKLCVGLPDETFLPHPISERKYIICINGETVESDCPVEFPIFNRIELYCDYEAITTNRPVPSRPTTTRPTPPAPNRPTTTNRPLPTRTTTTRPTTTNRPLPTRSTATNIQPPNPTPPTRRPPPSQ